MPAEVRTWVEVSGRAIRQNLRQFQRLAGPQVAIMPIVKANAYGHGQAEVSRILRTEKFYALGVAHGDEALALRATGYRGRIVVLTSWQAAELPTLYRGRVELVVWDFPSLQKIQAFQKRYHAKPAIHLKLDTGTSRIGFLPSDVKHLVNLLPGLRVGSVFSHLANAEEKSPERTRQQIHHFATLNSRLGLGSRVLRHIGCTAAALRYPEAHFGLIRLGIGLYGIWPSSEIKVWAKQNRPQVDVKPALEWKTRLVQVKTLPAGVSVGYGSTFITKRQTRIGIIPVGYSDGLDRRLSNIGWVIVGHKPAPIIGRVCMNLTILDLSNIRATMGQTVTLIGPGVTAEEVAKTTRTIAYEAVSRINPRIPRYLV